MMMMMSGTGVLKILKSLEKANIEIGKPNIEIALMMMKMMMMMSQTGVLKTQ